MTNAKSILVKAGLFVAGGAIGYGVGFYLTKKRVTEKYETFVQTELAKIKEDYADLKRRDTFISPAEAVAAKIGPDAVITEKDLDPDYEKAARIIQDNDYTLPGTSTDQNIFVDGAPYIPVEDEDGYVVIRDPNGPYIISEMLYQEHDPRITSESLIYYEADGVLADPADRPIDDVKGLIGVDGDDLQSMFGIGSNDPEIVYIRNEDRSIDLEITLNEGSFKQIALGELPRERPRPQPRMREGDGN